MSTEFEFYVNDVDDDRSFVIGRPSDNYIRLGDSFNKIRKYKFRDYPNDWDKPAEIEWEKEIIPLVIKKIHAYGKELDFIGGGTTAAIELEGDILQVRNRYVLVSDQGVLSSELKI